jgi:UDP-N-acetylmuramoylalanine--D-glutamate ligase
MNLKGKNTLVVGLGLSGRAAARLLSARGAQVKVVDSRDEAEVGKAADELRQLGISVDTGSRMVAGEFEFAVISPGLSPESELFRCVATGGYPLLSELELGSRLSACLGVAITGTNGKTTTTQLIEHLLNDCGKKSRAVGNIGVPICDVVAESAELDFLVMEASSFQLEQTEQFRPTISILTNITTDHMDRYPGMAEYALAKTRIFANQRPFDWAVVQSEALAYLRALGVTIPGRVVTFSAASRRADLHLDDNLIVSSLEGWEGPLLTMQQTRLRGPHNAENVMAALAVGRILQLPLENMIRSLKSFNAAPHRCELVGEMNGVQFVNDSKATNLDAMMKAIQATPYVSPKEPNVWLIAGGSDKGFEFHDAGPLLAQRVKGAILIGETSGRMKSAWNLFTNCRTADDLEEAVRTAAQQAELGDVILLSPACASFDQFSGYEERGNRFKEIVADLLRTTYSGAPYFGTTTDGNFTLNSNTEHQP